MKSYWFTLNLLSIIYKQYLKQTWRMRYIESALRYYIIIKKQCWTEIFLNAAWKTLFSENLTPVTNSYVFYWITCTLPTATGKNQLFMEVMTETIYLPPCNWNSIIVNRLHPVKANKFRNILFVGKLLDSSNCFGPNYYSILSSTFSTSDMFHYDRKKVLAEALFIGLNKIENFRSNLIFHSLALLEPNISSIRFMTGRLGHIYYTKHKYNSPFHYSSMMIMRHKLLRRRLLVCAEHKMSSLVPLLEIFSGYDYGVWFAFMFTLSVNIVDTSLQQTSFACDAMESQQEKHNLAQQKVL